MRCPAEAGRDSGFRDPRDRGRLLVALRTIGFAAAPSRPIERSSPPKLEAPPRPELIVRPATKADAEAVVDLLRLVGGVATVAGVPRTSPPGSALGSRCWSRTWAAWSGASRGTSCRRCTGRRWRGSPPSSWRAPPQGGGRPRPGGRDAGSGWQGRRDNRGGDQRAGDQRAAAVLPGGGNAGERGAVRNGSRITSGLSALRPVADRPPALISAGHGRRSSN
jgi:hypothetical protein